MSNSLPPGGTIAAVFLETNLMIARFTRSSIWIAVLSAASTSLVEAQGSKSGHWPSFRGTNASGVADGAALPEEWNVPKKKNA